MGGLAERGTQMNVKEMSLPMPKNGKQTTEQEYIQTCNTEQLADLMSRMVGCSNCPIPKDGRSCMGTYSGCWHEIIKWLKQPHTVKE